ncbi:MAG: TIGR02594 family protein [Vicinamibacterales bacterium]
MHEPIWLSVARAFVGVLELPGPGSNPLILRWATEIGAPAWYDSDAKAWCAVFLNRILLAVQQPMAGTGYALLRAGTFETYGVPLTTATLGAILVFDRPEGHHVGFYLGERDDAYLVLAGNQANAVSVRWILKSRLTAMRWPADVAVSETGPILITARDGGPSEDEA